MITKISEQLRPIFAPKSIAVIGASAVPFKWGNDVVRSMQKDGFKGMIYPINPKEKSILGLPAYRSVLDVPDQIELAVLTIRAEQVPRAMRECVQKGIKGAVLISAGFAETGSPGQAIQEEVATIARQGALRFVGPNCMGIYSAAANLNLSLPGGVQKGSIGFISQSGTFGGIFAREAANRDCGLSSFISAGNQADLDVADYLEYLSDDPATKVVVMYVEGLRDSKKLFDVGKKIAGQKPVIIYKAGKNQSVTRITQSHTASIAGEDRVFEAMCRQVGFIRVNDLLSLLDAAAILTKQPLPAGKRIGILGTGGLCVVLADTCLSMGMEVPELKEEHVKFIISDLDFPPHAPSPKNPVDFAGANRTALQEAGVLNKMAQLDYIDGLICNTPITWADPSKTSMVEQERLFTQAAELLTAIPQKLRKPVVTVGLSDIAMTDEIIEKAMESAGITSYNTPETAAKAMAFLIQYAEIRKRFPDRP